MVIERRRASDNTLGRGCGSKRGGWDTGIKSGYFVLVAALMRLPLLALPKLSTQLHPRSVR